MNLIEAASTAVSVGAVTAWVLALTGDPIPVPRAKPEPSVIETAMPTIKVEPESPRAQEQRRVDEVSKDVQQVNHDIEEIKKAVRLQQALKGAVEKGDPK